MVARQAAATDTTDEQPAEAGVDESRIRDIVRDVVAELGLTNNGGGPGDSDGDDDDSDGEKPPAAGRRTQASVEDDVESKVRAAIGKLRTEEERDTRLSALEEKVAKAPPERAPVKERVSTRLMGWNRGT